MQKPATSKSQSQESATKRQSLVAWHEAGHAVMAALTPARILCVAPDAALEPPAGVERSLQAALGGVACHLSYAQALGLFGKPSPFGKVLRGPPRHAVPAKALVQATVFLLQRRALVARCTPTCTALRSRCRRPSLWRLPRVRAGSSFSKCARCSPASTTSRRSRGRKASRPTRCVISSRRTTSVSC